MRSAGKQAKAQLDLFDEIIADNFAGGGGASTGIELAAGRPVTIAINHDPDAILMHKTNHPYTAHYQASVWDIDPREVCRGRPVGLARLQAFFQGKGRKTGGQEYSRTGLDRPALGRDCSAARDHAGEC